MPGAAAGSAGSPSESEPRTVLGHLARTARLVVFSGLPATGKSFLVNRLAHAGGAAGRAIHLLQWDVARPVVEACGPGRAYPMRDGVTHPVVRKAVGLWARAAVAEWHARHPGPADLLIAEAPLVGHRAVELARPAADDAEALLAGGADFVIPVPSVELRRRLAGGRVEAMRFNRSGREREDALPSVMESLWAEVARVAVYLGVIRTPDDAPAYDPRVYEAVYRAALARRRARTLRLREWAPDAPASAYAFTVVVRDLVPDEREAARWVRAVEARHPDAGALEAEMAGWYKPSAP